jgi:hypothetical protein
MLSFRHRNHHCCAIMNTKALSCCLSIIEIAYVCMGSLHSIMAGFFADATPYVELFVSLAQPRQLGRQRDVHIHHGASALLLLRFAKKRLRGGKGGGEGVEY